MGTATATPQDFRNTRILVADDDPVSLCLISTSLRSWGFEPITVGNGLDAWQALQREQRPKLAILDWMMPDIDGPEVCRRVRDFCGSADSYLILLTARSRREDVVAGLEAGADDYLTKPFDRGELHARLRVGLRILDLQKRLADRVQQLEEAVASIKQLRGLLPICSYCKKIRKDGNYWQQVESYIGEHTEAQFSHGICPDCYERHVQPEIDKILIPGSAL